MVDVSGCHLPYTTGTLRGFSRWAVKRELYPAVVQDNDGTVNGVVYLNVPDSAWNRLDQYEGEMYNRQSVDIVSDNGETIYAEIYVLQPGFINQLDGSDWDFDDFVANGKAIFQQRFK